MRRILALCAFFLFLSLTFAAACKPAIKTVNLAAVMENGAGSIVPLEVEIRPGSGNIYTSIEPKTGMSTQESQEKAVRFAFKGNNSGCDVFFRVKALGGTPFVDGPSAGAAMALGVAAALEGKNVRSDIVITGTISEEGKVGDVGGIAEKAIASAKEGKRGMLTPKQQLYEHIVLSTLGRDYNFTGREVESFEEAKMIAFSPAGSVIEAKFTLKSSPLPANLQPIEKDADLQLFSGIAQNEIDAVKKDASEVKPGSADGELADFQKYIGDEVAKQEKLNGMGYVYTAANSAFLLGIDTEFLNVGSRGIDLEGSKRDVQACLERVRIPQKTAANFYWVTGAKLRRAWGERKLADTGALMKETEVQYPLLREMLFAQGWCDVSAQLAIARVGEGAAVNESALEGLARMKVKGAEEALAKNEPDSDARWHLEIAKGLLANKSYAEAVYDATYARAMVQARRDVIDNPAAARANASELAAQNRSSLWGKIYSGQAKYIYAQDAASADAYRMLKFAREIDAASGEIDAALANGGKDYPADAQVTGDWNAEVQSNAAGGAANGIAGANAGCAGGEEVLAAAQKQLKWRDGMFAACFLVLLWVFGACVFMRAGKVRWNNGRKK